MNRIFLVIVIAFAALCATSGFAQTKAGNAANGKQIFAKNGCYQCHGYVGQGGLAGPRLAQTKLSLVAFMAYVRNPAPGGMPPYRAKVMSDQELGDVFAYIQSFPEPQPARNIPLLSQ
jgi:mono/diheme cytochrome c family protein